MDASQQQNLQDLIRLSQEMLQLAQQENDEAWEEIEQKEQLRRQLIDSIFAEKIPDEDAQLVGTSIQQVQKITDQITLSLQNSKRSLSMEISQLNRAKSATHAYLKFAK